MAVDVEQQAVRDEAELEWLRGRARLLGQLAGEVALAVVPDVDDYRWRGEAGRAFSNRLVELRVMLNTAQLHLESSRELVASAAARLERALG